MPRIRRSLKTNRKRRMPSLRPGCSTTVSGICFGHRRDEWSLQTVSVVEVLAICGCVVLSNTTAGQQWSSPRSVRPGARCPFTGTRRRLASRLRERPSTDRDRNRQLDPENSAPFTTHDTRQHRVHTPSALFSGRYAATGRSRRRRPRVAPGMQRHRGPRHETGRDSANASWSSLNAAPISSNWFTGMPTLPATVGHSRTFAATPEMISADWSLVSR